MLDRAPVPKDGRITIERVYQDLPELFGNPRELGQALSTIVTNAIEAIEGAGTVRVLAEHVDGEIRIAIIDSGRGVPEAELGGLFDVALRKGDRRVAASFGLPAAQSVAHRHGGRIHVDSEVGAGSRFTLHIPVAAPD